MCVLLTNNKCSTDFTNWPQVRWCGLKCDTNVHTRLFMSCISRVQFAFSLSAPKHLLWSVQESSLPPPPPPFHPPSHKSFYSILGCVHPPQKAALRQSPPTFIAILVHTAPCSPTMSSLQRRFGLPTDLTPFICHSVLLIVQLLSFIWVMCPAHFHFAFVNL